MAIVGDVGLYHIGRTGSINPVNLDNSTLTYMAGPRLSYRTSDVVPYVQGLAGETHLNHGFDSGAAFPRVLGDQNLLTWSVGRGLDVPLGAHFAIKPAQIDYVMERFEKPSQHGMAMKGDIRYTAGVVFRFGTKYPGSLSGPSARSPQRFSFQGISRTYRSGVILTALKCNGRSPCFWACGAR